MHHLYRTPRAAATLGLMIVLLAGAGAAQPSATQPPLARRSAAADTLHGVVVRDPYRWMEAMDAPETLAWIRANDAHARTMAASFPGRDSIRDLIASIATVERFGAPAIRGDRLFTIWFGSTGPAAGAEVRLHTGRSAPPRTILPGTLRSGPPATVVQRAVPSPSGRLLAYTSRVRGESWGALHILDVDGGRTLADSLSGLRMGRSTVTWTRGDTALIYVRYPQPGAAGGDVSHPTVLLHRVGTPQSSDVTLYAHAGSPEALVVHRVSDDGRTLVLMVQEPGDSFNSVAVRDLSQGGAPVRRLIPTADATYDFVGVDGARLLFRTDLDAANGRVVSVDPASPGRGDWKDIVREGPDAISTWSSSLERAGGVSAVGGRLIVEYVHDGAPVVRIHDMRGRIERVVELPRLGAIWSGFAGRQDEPVAVYTIAGLADPGTAYTLDVRTGRSTRLNAPVLPYDADELVTRQVFYRGKDGTRIPMYVTHKRGLELDGTAAVWMYGYGHGAWSAAPWFQAHMVAWVQRGGVWALPNLRGGGEYGEAWHRAGIRTQKQTAIDDYIAAAEWLVANGYAAPNRVVANTSSAGGPLVAAAVVQRPDVFGAGIIDYPLVDVLRAGRFPGAAPAIPDYGTPDDPASFAALFAYAPLQNAVPGRCLPPVMIAPGELDRTTVPLHAYKLAATLQHVQARTPGCTHPVVLRVSWGAGHSSGATVAESVETWADQLAFLELVLPPPPRH